ncbi:HlyD family type I secretion periplasmic adaptor subunit [Tabrizicola sp.]|uniref:HlyD family type I secretion periplasmic adaptor subunit n=1 Tax=Tabrizicola sp. TaxID=2005166 RepID=UPI00286C13D8|nr:HlyD family type I secretion periplasmic adaptor subunit [Tabrizicola sp.]
MTLSVRAPVTLGLAAIAALVLGFGLWGTMTELSGAVVAHGKIEVEQNRQIVQHPDGGVVAEINVHEGDVVAAGDVLIRLDGAALKSELTIVEDQLTEFTARSTRLLAERDGSDTLAFPPDLVALAATKPEVAAQIDGQSRLFQARRNMLDLQTLQLSRRIDQIRAQIEGISAQQAALATQAALIAQELASQQSLLNKGLTQAGSVLALQREEARLNGQVGELAASLAQSQGQITEIEVQISGLTTKRLEDATTELRDLGPAALELAERQRALAERIARLEVRAPVAGVVLGLQVTTPRAVIRPADPVLYLIPQDRPLMITAQIQPTQIDEVVVGQPVELAFSAFSSRAVPHLFGTVSVLSADALVNPDTGAAYYRAEIMLGPDQMAKLGDHVLLPGMPVDVFVQTGMRTPLAYLLQPFTDYFSRAFRES